MDFEVWSEYFAYDPLSGVITWKKAPNNRAKVGREAGSINKHGYKWVCLGGKKIGAHRAAWILYYGEWPTKDIDHINGNRTDNRIANLRQVSELANNQNLRKATCRSKTGLLGVCVDKKGYLSAKIRICGKVTYLGSFDTPEAAHEAYVAAKRKFHEGCTI